MGEPRGRIGVPVSGGGTEGCPGAWKELERSPCSTIGLLPQGDSWPTVAGCDCGEQVFGLEPVEFYRPFEMYCSTHDRVGDSSTAAQERGNRVPGRYRAKQEGELMGTGKTYWSRMGRRGTYPTTG